MGILTKTHDPKFRIVILGAFQITGFTESMYTIEPDKENFTDMSGADGQTDRANTNNSMYTVTLNLMYGSSAMTQINALIQADKLSNLGVFPLVIRDANSLTDIFVASDAWIQTEPTKEVGAEAPTYEIVIRAKATNSYGTPII